MDVKERITDRVSQVVNNYMLRKVFTLSRFFKIGSEDEKMHAFTIWDLFTKGRGNKFLVYLFF